MKITCILSFFILFFQVNQPINEDLSNQITITKVNEKNKELTVYTFDRDGKILSQIGKAFNIRVSMDGEFLRREIYFNYDSMPIFNEMRRVDIKKDKTQDEVIFHYDYSYDSNGKPTDLVLKNGGMFPLTIERQYFYDSDNGSLSRIKDTGTAPAKEDSILTTTTNIVFKYDENNELVKKTTSIDNNVRSFEIFKKDKNKFSVSNTIRKNNEENLSYRITQTYNKDNELKKCKRESFTDPGMSKQVYKFYRENGIINQIKVKNYFPNGKVGIYKNKFILNSDASINDKATIKRINKTLVELEVHQQYLRDYILENPTPNLHGFY